MILDCNSTGFVGAARAEVPSVDGRRGEVFDGEAAKLHFAGFRVRLAQPTRRLTVHVRKLCLADDWPISGCRRLNFPGPLSLALAARSSRYLGIARSNIKQLLRYFVKKFGL